MHFKITARTILQLGAELISSDAIAFYELIKNAFDAKSSRATVRVVSRIDHEKLAELMQRVVDIDDEEDLEDDLLANLKQKIWSETDKDSYHVDYFERRIQNSESKSSLIELLNKANYILFSDTGDGMSLRDLEDIYLTIGTRNRRKQKENLEQDSRPILGEKGLGRLSVMRLGDAVKIETTQTGDLTYNVLEIDWNVFSNDSDDLIESIDLEPQVGKTKENSSEQGTKIYIYNLKEKWTQKKLREIAGAELSRFIDPFEKKNRDFIKLWFNKEAIVLENIDRTLFQYAHAIVEAKLEFDENGKPSFRGNIEYRVYERSKSFNLDGVHLLSVAGIDSQRTYEQLVDLGPFEVKFYWFNRQRLTKKLGVLDHVYIKDLVNNWGGGLMVYRDGFRVNPYGGPNDDWLNLDKKALSSGGYKLNRKQIVGKVDISTFSNRGLIDQTNREGLRDNDEKKLLVSLLQYLINTETRDFMDDAKEEAEVSNAILTMSDIERRVVSGQRQIKSVVRELRVKYPVLEEESETLETIENILDESAQLFKLAKLSSRALEDRLKTTLDLAGLGLMVDVIGHELGRSTEHAMNTINQLSNSNPIEFQSTLKTLKSQLKTLQARLKVIDPLGPSGRQTKETIDLKKLINDVVNSHLAQFERHGIRFKLVDNDEKAEWNIKVVPGMIIQILENLLSNSVYWIKRQQNMDNSYQPQILIEIDRSDNTILFQDNGPGIPRERKDEVFRAFFTTKPAKEAAGRGLGLYISREVAKYHGATLDLIDNGNSSLNQFILTIKN